MPFTVPTPDVGALQSAARRFMRRLAAETGPGAAERIEAEVLTADAEGVFQCEAALVAAWPAAAGRAPRREIIWTAGGAGTEAGVRLQAFDAAGRLLLHLSYGRGAEEAAK
jgi:hypothetical protein